jgi:general secretion pathway protein K
MALVLVLMIVTLITAMVVEFAYGVYVNTNALHNWQTSQKLSLTAKSATRLASRLISTNMIEQYKTRAAFEMSQQIPFGDLDGTITLRIEDENAKFNLNSLRYDNRKDNEAAYAFFGRLLDVLDLEPDIANMVSYWINASSDHRPQNSGSIQPKDTYLDSVDELLAIPGIDKKSYDRLLPYVTIFGCGMVPNCININVNTADVPIIMSLAETTISKETAEMVISSRPLKGPGQLSEFGIKPISPEVLISLSSSAYHVVATAESGGIKRIIESVLQGNTVKYWKEM